MWLSWIFHSKLLNYRRVTNDRLVLETGASEQSGGSFQKHDALNGIEPIISTQPLSQSSLGSKRINIWNDTQTAKGKNRISPIQSLPSPRNTSGLLLQPRFWSKTAQHPPRKTVMQLKHGSIHLNKKQRCEESTVHRDPLTNGQLVDMEISGVWFPLFTEIQIFDERNVPQRVETSFSHLPL